MLDVSEKFKHNISFLEEGDDTRLRGSVRCSDYLAAWGVLEPVVILGDYVAFSQLKTVMTKDQVIFR